MRAPSCCEAEADGELDRPDEPTGPEPGPEGFDFAPSTRVVFGPGCVEQLGELAREHGARRVLLVTDPGIVEAGHVDRAANSLEAAGLWVSVFDRVVENPTTLVVDDCVAQARADGVDFLVGLGGGSSMDTAKGCNFLLTGGGRMEDYWGVGKATEPMLPLIAVPTTAGTGSECQSFALISQPETHRKMACGDRKAAARVAILDPVLTLTQPPGVAGATGVDALAHAVESAVCRKRNPMSQLFSREAFRRCAGGLERVFADPEDVDARGEMLLGAALGGMAIENSMLGAAHAASNPVTARYELVHGQSVGVMLPWVVRFNAEDPETRAAYHQLALDAGLVEDPGDDAAGAEAVARHIERCLTVAGLAGSLAELGVEPADFDTLAEEAAEQWTGRFNPRPVAAEDFRALYESALRRQTDQDTQRESQP